MQEQLIGFETAKLAKEKGFDIVEVDYVYCIGYNTLKSSDELIESKQRKNLKGQPHLALAPTQALLQKWLRDKHKIQIEVFYRIGDFYSYKIFKTIDEAIELELNHLEKDSDKYASYEESLEKALFESLILINNERSTNKF